MCVSLTHFSLALFVLCMFLRYSWNRADLTLSVSSCKVLPRHPISKTNLALFFFPPLVFFSHCIFIHSHTRSLIFVLRYSPVQSKPVLGGDFFTLSSSSSSSSSTSSSLFSYSQVQAKSAGIKSRAKSGHSKRKSPQSSSSVTTVASATEIQARLKTLACVAAQALFRIATCFPRALATVLLWLRYSFTCHFLLHFTLSVSLALQHFHFLMTIFDNPESLDTQVLSLFCCSLAKIGRIKNEIMVWMVVSLCVCVCDVCRSGLLFCFLTLLFDFSIQLRHTHRMRL